MAAEASPSGYPKPRYGKEIVGKRLMVWKDNTWRTGQLTSYHGGYYRHTIKYDDTGEAEQNHTYALEYQFLPEPDAEPIPDLLNTAVSVLLDNNKWYKGTVVGFDGLSHTVIFDDGDTDHITLQKDRYKVLDGTHPLPPKPRPRSASKAAEVAGSGAQQGSQAAALPAKQLRTNISNPLAASRPGASKPASKAGSALSGGGGGGSGAAGGQGASSAAAAAADSRGEAHRPLTREERERRGGSVEKDRSKFYQEATGRNEKRLPQLNMSHVSKKDREAARMLLGFSTPTAGEGMFAAGGYGDGKGSRAAIAAVTAAAAAAAGFSDPGDLYSSEAAAAAATNVRDGMGLADGAAAAGAAGAASPGAGSPTGSGGAGGLAGTSAVSQLTHQVLSGMQWQMQQLVNQEEQRWLEVTTLQTKVARLQRERDEARSSRDHVMVERDVALQQVRQLQDEKAHLASQVQVLQDEAARLLGQLNVERGMSSNAALDAAALRTQLSNLRSELTQCRTEASQLLNTIRQPTSGSFAGALGGLGSISGLSGYGGMGTMGGSMGGGMGGGMAAAMLGYGGHSSLGGMENAGAAAAGNKAGPPAAAAAAAAAPVGLVATKKGGMQRLGPSASGGTSFRLGGGAEGGSRTAGKGNLMQMGPGTLVVGPRSRQQQQQQQLQQQQQQQQGRSWPDSHAAQAAAVLAASQSAAAAAASLDAIAAAAPVPELPALAQGEEPSSPHQEQDEQEQLDAGKQEQGAAAAATADADKPAGGSSAALNNTGAADCAEAGAGSAVPAGVEHSGEKAEHEAVEALLTTSEAALAVDDGEGDTMSQPAALPEHAAAQADAANLSAGRRAGRPSRKPLASGSNFVLAGAAADGEMPKPTPSTTRKRTRASAAQEQQEEQRQQDIAAPAEKKLAANEEAARAASPVVSDPAGTTADAVDANGIVDGQRAATPLSEEAPSLLAAGAKDEDGRAADEVMGSAEHSPSPAAQEEEALQLLQEAAEDDDLQDAGAEAGTAATAGDGAEQAAAAGSREGSAADGSAGDLLLRETAAAEQQQP